ncbi:MULTISPECIES: DUF1700 domain-containing protein [unclassified Janthinobacterium]|uniref:DUF1700 domain-containing protein n=1 Tax=unclassified Janthinobacterium TaxID=2610881 RepID=UPI0003470912|nr:MULTISPECIES: DUF1700 domain-containing protein [unclassified Janthinobacterium]MEC5160751.1 putative membrane protein [Janthinobacterium sp. CG_S6]
MSKLDYIDALRRALAGLPAETLAKTLAYYEQRFIDGLAAGRSEAEIAADLGEPKKIAVTLRASTHLSAFERTRNPANFARLVGSALGLAIFNLFMVLPAMVYSALLAAMYVAALAFYVGGIAITASGLSGANELVLDGPLRHFMLKGDERGEPAQTRISIGGSTIQVIQEPASGARHDGDKGESEAEDEAGDAPSSSRVMRRAEALAGGGLHISTDLDHDSRSVQTMFGMAMVLCGIVFFLLSLVVTKYTLFGIKRYIEMNFTLLKGR